MDVDRGFEVPGNFGGKSLCICTYVAALVFVIAARTSMARGMETTRRLHAPRSRMEFAKAVGRLKVGMTTDEVRRILGDPDIVRVFPGTEERGFSWCYGTRNEDRFPTLGRVNFDGEHKVDIANNLSVTSTPPEPTVISEDALRRLLCVLGRLPPAGTYMYDPLPIIRAVNALWPLGKETALAVLREYRRIASPNTNVQSVFYVLRVLFTVPESALSNGPPSIPAGALRVLPDFPFSLVGDVPLLVIRASDNTWFPRDAYIDVFERHGRIRPRPLSPAAFPFLNLDVLADKVTTVTEDLMGVNSAGRDPGFQRWQKIMLGGELLRALWPAKYERMPPQSIISDLYGRSTSDDVWGRYEVRLCRLCVHWSASQQMYVMSPRRE